MYAHKFFFLLSTATSSLHVIQVAISAIVPNNNNDCPSPLSLSPCAVIDPVDSESSQGTNFANNIADQPDMVQTTPLSFDVDPMSNPQF